FEFVAHELRARGLPGAGFSINEDVRRSFAAKRADEDRRHVVDLFVAVWEAFGGVGGPKNVFIFEDRLAVEEVVEQPLWRPGRRGIARAILGSVFGVGGRVRFTRKPVRERVEVGGGLARFVRVLGLVVDGGIRPELLVVVVGW